MDLHIDLTGRGGLTDQIYLQIRAAVLEGRLRGGDKVPSTRELAARLGVSRNTASTAYDRLVAEGFLTARPGVRTFVSQGIGTVAAGVRPPVRSAIKPRSIWESRPDPPDAFWAVRARYDFLPGGPDMRGFPFATWRTLLGRELRQSSIGTGTHSEPAGHDGLRAAIARHIGVSRGVRTSADDVHVTNGTQQAVDLIGRVLIEPGDVVAVEDPGWLPPRALFEALGARVVGVPVDVDGLVVAELPARARLVYVSPSHQFPAGVAMSLPRRLSLLEWAQRSGACVVEDDYDSEFRYVGRPIEPLHSLDQTGRVVYLGSFSKTLMPALRLGFCVAPASLRPALRKAKYLMDWHTTLPLQAALARFIDDGLFARHLRRMRRVYARRREAMLEVLHRDLADRLDPLPAVAGLHLGVRLLDPTLDDRAVADLARGAGVAVAAWSDFAVSGRSPRGLVLGYGRIDTDRIEPGLRLLRHYLEPARRAQVVTGS